MEYLSQLHFIRPLVLWSLPVVALILWYMQQKNSKEDGWSKICDPHLLDAIKVRSAGQGSRLTWLLWPISLIAILALAGPAFQKLPTPVIKNQSALVIVLDVSKSMLSDDIKPNRLERAKYKINDILEQRKDGQTALLVYSGDAFVVTPLTDDTQTIALMLKAISPEIMPVQGSRADIALGKAKDLLKQAGYPSGDVLLITDGVKASKAIKMAKNLSKDRIKISVLGVGTKQGAPIPLQTGFVKDRQGNIVIPKLQISALKDLAANGKGRFAQITGDSSDIDYLVPSVVDDKKEPQSFDEEDTFDSQKYIDEGPWLVLLLIPLVALLFRKGLLLGLFLVVGLQSPQSSYAFSFEDLWLNADQQAAKQLQQGDAKKALELAQSNQWKATAAFKNKDYKQAQELFNDGTADGLYNQGNALAASGKLEQALKSYEEALKIRPNDEDTLFNKKQVEEALKKQKEQQQKDQKNKDKQDKDKQDKDKQDKDQQNQDQKNQDQKDQEKQDSENKDSQQNKDQKDKEGEKKDGQQNQEDNPDNKKQEEKSSQMNEEEKKKQEEEQKKLEQADKEAKEKQQQEQEKKLEQKKLTPQEMAQEAENKEAIEQWLRRIPDDPGGLLRRKFYYQYNQQNNKPDETEDW